MHDVAATNGGNPTRRAFLRGATAGLTVLAFDAPAALADSLKPLRFGLCADVHKDIMHDADSRMARFVKEMSERKADFICQLGDFCQPLPRNQAFLDAFHSFPRESFHVLGNHDMDGGATREKTCKFWGVETGYHSFVRGGYRFLILDGNDTHEGAPGGYARHIGADQRKWVAKTLAESDEPTIVFSHQSLENGSGVDNGGELRKILELANERAGWGRILACFSGHHHLDAVVTINDIHYVQVNSMSYYWVGGSKRHRSYPEEIHEAYPWIECTSPYEDPLWAFVTIEPGGSLAIEGVRSAWVGPSPKSLGIEEGSEKRGVSPQISARRLEATPRPAPPEDD